MIKEVTLKRWKSFEEATLYIDPLTVVIGLNASGKSNILDALLFLQRSVVYRDLFTALKTDNHQQSIRGGLGWAVLRGNETFELEVKFERQRQEYASYDLVYTTEISVSLATQEVLVVREALKEIETEPNKKPRATNIFWTDSIENNSKFITARTRGKKVKPHELSRKESVLSQLRYSDFKENLKLCVLEVIQALEGIFILDPIPQNMRVVGTLEVELAPDGSNIAGVIASRLPEKEILKKLTYYARQLPEREIDNINVGVFGVGNKVVLYGEEKQPDGKLLQIDTSAMSDGTLRFLAILTAILTAKKGTLLMIEEIDNGIHPSRAKLLLEILQKEGSGRGVDILVTSHNESFLNELTPRFLPIVMLTYRDKISGYSKIKPIEDIDNLPFLLGKGYLGDIVAEESNYQFLTN
jgi:AAA15 family ATPase/GTPase